MNWKVASYVSILTILISQRLLTPSRSDLAGELYSRLTSDCYLPWPPGSASSVMGAYYDEVEIEDMAWDEEKRVYHYPCPCGDRFEISKKQLKNYEDIATCPSCSLIIRVVYDPVCLSL